MAYSAKEKLEKLLEFVIKREENRTELSLNAMDKNNLLLMQIYNAASCECTKMRYTIEDMLSHNGSNPEWDSMEFNEAYKYLREGRGIKLPEWNEYWFWSGTLNTIIVHYENNIEVDIRDVKNFIEYVLNSIVRNDWVVIEKK